MNVLVTAASHEGSTLEIAEAIACALRRSGFSVTVAPPTAVDDVTQYDAAVVGSAVYRGRWLEPAVDLVRRHANELRRRPVWLFSSGPIGDPARAIVRRMAVAPPDLPMLMRSTGARGHRMFGGKLTLDQVSPLRRVTLMAVRGLAGDWRPWEEIDAWATSIADELSHADWFRRLGEETAGAPPEQRRAS